jgi:hypothetical protein
MEYGDEDFIAWMADLIEQQELENGQEKEEDHDN